MFIKRSKWFLAALGVIASVAGFPDDAKAYGPAGELSSVNLFWRPAAQTVQVGEVVDIGLYVAAKGDFDHVISSLTAIFEWDTQYLRLLGRVDNSPYDWLVSDFPGAAGIDVDGLNNTWSDGNAFYAALGQLNPEPLPLATTDGLLVATIQFQALALTPSNTVVNIPPDLGGLSATEVFDGTIPGTPVTGEPGAAIVKIVPEPATLALLLVGTAAFRIRRR